MSTVAQMEQQILQGIRDWMGLEHLTQRQAATVLGTMSSHVSAMLAGRRRYSLNALLRFWQATGGRCELRLDRPDEPAHVTAAPLVMADGCPLYQYLRDAAPPDTPMDEFTRGYEECKRRLFVILGPQLQARNE